MPPRKHVWTAATDDDDDDNGAGPAEEPRQPTRRSSARSVRAGKRLKLTDDDERPPRSVLDMFPSAPPSGRLNIITPPLTAAVLEGDSRFKVYANVDVQGDCYYDCVCKAYNSQQDNTGCMTVETLRLLISSTVTAANFEGRRSMVVADTEAHDPDKADMYNQLDLDAFKQTMLTSEYYATSTDVLATIEVLGITPIVLNSLYGTRAAVQGSERKALQAYPLMPYMREGAVVPVFVLLYRKGEHFQLVVRSDRKLMARDGITEATIDGQIVYNAIFGLDDLPKTLLMNAGMIPHPGDEVSAYKRA